MELDEIPAHIASLQNIHYSQWGPAVEWQRWAKQAHDAGEQELSARLHNIAEMMYDYEKWPSGHWWHLRPGGDINNPDDYCELKWLYRITKEEKEHPLRPTVPANLTCRLCGARRRTNFKRLP